MDQLKLLLLLCYVTTSIFVESNGKSILSSSSTFLDRLRSRRDTSELFMAEQFPASMANERFYNEFIQTDQLELIVNSSKLYGTDCPSSHSQLPVDAPVYARSNCPWYYQLRHDPDRFPTSLPVAVKKCDHHCLGLREDITDDFICDYVYNDVTVLQKKYHKNNIYFQEKIERIPVGSTCVRKMESK